MYIYIYLKRRWEREIKTARGGRIVLVSERERKGFDRIGAVTKRGTGQINMYVHAYIHMYTCIIH